MTQGPVMRYPYDLRAQGERTYERGWRDALRADAALSVRHALTIMRLRQTMMDAAEAIECEATSAPVAEALRAALSETAP